jgi:hypothetical protein
MEIDGRRFHDIIHLLCEFIEDSQVNVRNKILKRVNSVTLQTYEFRNNTDFMFANREPGTRVMISDWAPKKEQRVCCSGTVRKVDE